MAWACLTGLMLDLTADGPLGPHAVALLAGAYLTGFWVRNLDRETLLHPVVAAAASTAVYSAVLVLADDLLGLPVPQPAIAIQLVVAASVYNAALMPFVLGVVRKLHSPVTRRPEPV
jgi:rod shape-determining protein MreD